MPGVIDTNVLLYAANADAPEHPAAIALLTAAGSSADTWYLTEGILYEFLRVATHARVFPRPLSATEALAFLAPLLASPRFLVLGTGARHWDVLGEVIAEATHPAGNLFFDLRTVALMRENGVRRIYTSDTDFLQFSDLEVVNPVRP